MTGVDVSEQEELLEAQETTKVLLVGLDTGEETDFEHSMEELKSLAEAADKKVVGIIVQRMENVNKALYIGSGKVAEVREYAGECEADEIVFDNSLSPSQVRNLGRELELTILDRTDLILDIFALRARTKEAKLQVEIAKLQYILPRLVGMREALSRQGGTSGSMSSRGVGEKKLELDRRKIERRISELHKELQSVERTRETMRKKRGRSGVPQVALVGYTNAGKSTLMNRIVDLYGEKKEKTVLEKDMLFATLDTNVRSIHTGDHRPFFLVDTVGFINKLPHSLVKAFHSTLEEVCRADLLVQVVDVSDEHYKEQMRVTAETLIELGAGGIPQVIAFNKADKCRMERLPRRGHMQLHMAAAQGAGIEELVGLIKEILYAGQVEENFLIPYEKGDIVSCLMENAAVLSQEFREDGVWLRVCCGEILSERFREYRCGTTGGMTGN